MPISDLCNSDFICIQSGESLKQAAQLMKQHNVGSLVVVEADNKMKPIGVITDRDIVLGVVADSQSADNKVDDVMSTDIVKVTKDEGIAEAVDEMESHSVRRMVIVDEAGDACGLVSSDDILQLVARELNGLGRIMQRQSSSSRAPMV